MVEIVIFAVGILLGLVFGKGINININYPTEIIEYPPNDMPSEDDPADHWKRGKRFDDEDEV